MTLYTGKNSFNIKMEGNLPLNADVKWTFSDGMVVRGKVGTHGEIRRRFCAPGEYSVKCESEGIEHTIPIDIDDGGIELAGVVDQAIFKTVDNVDMLYIACADGFQFDSTKITINCIREKLLGDRSERLAVVLRKNDIVPTNSLLWENLNNGNNYNLKLYAMLPHADNDLSFTVIVGFDGDFYNDGCVALAAASVSINEDWSSYLIYNNGPLLYNGKEVVTGGIPAWYTKYPCGKTLTHWALRISNVTLDYNENMSLDYPCLYSSISSGRNIDFLRDSSGEIVNSTKLIASDGKENLVVFYDDYEDDCGFYVNGDKVELESIPGSMFNIHKVDYNGNTYHIAFDRESLLYMESIDCINIESGQIVKCFVTSDVNFSDYIIETGIHLDGTDNSSVYSFLTNMDYSVIPIKLHMEMLDYENGTIHISLIEDVVTGIEKIKELGDDTGDHCYVMTSIAKYNKAVAFIHNCIVFNNHDDIESFVNRVYIPYVSEE